MTTCRTPIGTEGCTRSASRRGRRRPRFAAVSSLHTLGPAGTNCELAAREWSEREGVRPRVALHPTFEAAAAAVAATPGAALLVPAAYPALHTLVYSHLGQLELADAFVTSTHRMVLARRPGGDESRPRTVASHSAPVALVPTECEIRPATSNAAAAAACARGEADGCITTEPAMVGHELVPVQDFGAVAMAFTIHLRTT